MNRRGFLTGLSALIAAPAIVRAGNLMPIKVMPIELEVYGASPAMLALDGIEYLEGLSMRLLTWEEDAIVFTRIPTSAWREMNMAAPSGVWRGMPGGAQ